MNATPLVTVCVPAYRAARFLPQTLDSIRRQTFRDFVVRVAIEPNEAQETLDACVDFGSDPRFELSVNETALGWTGNVRRLLGEVRTPLFAVLPHDDLWHPLYLEALVGLLDSRPEAVAAFPDTFVFEASVGRRTAAIPDGPTWLQLLAFFVTGAKHYPWQGLARNQVLAVQFPDNDFNGFAVDCEWSAQLVVSGLVLRLPQLLYFKRDWPDGRENVTKTWRRQMGLEELRSALSHHRHQMLALIQGARLTEEHAALVTLAAETAMLVRRMTWLAPRSGISELDLEEFESLRATLERNGGPIAVDLLSRLLVARSRHLVQLGQPAEARAFAQRAVDYGPADAEALMQLSRLMLQNQEALAALPLITRASVSSPLALGLTELQLESSRHLIAAFPPGLSRA